MSHLFPDNFSVIQYENMLLRLHDLFRLGQDESDEAEQIRDEMSEPERFFTQDDVHLLNGLSADLYMLQNQEIYETLKQGETQETLKQDLAKAYQAEDMPSLLRCLRKAPNHISAEGVASLRAYAYEKLGLIESSLRFLFHAASLSATPNEYLLSTLPLLQQTGRTKVAESISRTIAFDKSMAPEKRFIAVKHLYEIYSYQESQFTDKVRGDVLPNILEVIDAVDEQLSAKYEFLGRCYTIVGNVSEARRAYEKHFQLHPDDENARAEYYLLASDAQRASVAARTSSHILVSLTKPNRVFATL